MVGNGKSESHSLKLMLYVVLSPGCAVNWLNVYNIPSVLSLFYAHFTLSLHSLYALFTLSLRSFYAHFTLTLRSPYAHLTLTLRSLYAHLTLTLRSLYAHLMLTLRSLWGGGLTTIKLYLFTTIQEYSTIFHNIPQYST